MQNIHEASRTFWKVGVSPHIHLDKRIVFPFLRLCANKQGTSLASASAFAAVAGRTGHRATSRPRVFLRIRGLGGKRMDLRQQYVVCVGKVKAPFRHSPYTIHVRIMAVEQARDKVTDLEVLVSHLIFT